MIPDPSLSRRVGELERRLRETEHELRAMRQNIPATAPPRECWLAEVLDDYTIGSTDTVYRVRLISATAGSTPGPNAISVTQRGSTVSAFAWVAQASYSAGDRVIVERIGHGLLSTVNPATNTDWVITTQRPLEWCWLRGTSVDMVYETPVELLAFDYLTDGMNSGNCAIFYGRRIKITSGGLFWFHGSCTYRMEPETNPYDHDANAQLWVNTTGGIGANQNDGWCQVIEKSVTTEVTAHCNWLQEIATDATVYFMTSFDGANPPSSGYFTADNWKLTMVKVASGWPVV